MTRVRIPADVDRPDRIFARLTARQLLLLAPAVLVAALIGHLGLAAGLPLPFVAVAVMPPLAVGLTLALVGRDGLPLDRYVAAAWRHRRAPTLHLPPTAAAGTPGWLPDTAAAPRRRTVPAAPLARRVETAGLVDLGPDGVAVLATVAGLPATSLAAPGEQAARLAAMAGMLDGLSGPLQITVRTVPAGLGPLIRQLRDGRTGIASPELASAAAGHADYLAGLGAGRAPLARQILLTAHEPVPAGAGPAGRQLAAGRALARLDDAAHRLTAAGLTIRVLDGQEAERVLAAAAHPTGTPPAIASGPADGPLAGPGHSLPTWPTVLDQPAPAGRAGRRRRQRRRTERGQAPAGPLMLTPPGLRVAPRHLEIGDGYTTTLLVTGYPREVGPGWLEPLLAYPGRLDVALHIAPVPGPVAAARLRRQRARLESGRYANQAAGRLSDPELDVAAQDAAELAGRIARSEARLYGVSLYLTIHADSLEQLAEERRRVTALAHSLLLTVHPATYRMLAGWASTLPLGRDLLAARRTMDSTATATLFPFTADPPLPDLHRVGAGPVVYGLNPRTGGLVAHDRWAAPNHNSVTLAASGAGKSYLTKIDVLRSLYQGVEVHVVDPDGEYGRLAAAVAGTVIPLGAPGVHVNPLDLPAHARSDPDLLTRRALFTHTLVSTLLAGESDSASTGLTSGERAALDRAILTAYRHAGITTDPASWTRPAPLLADLETALRADPTDPAGPSLASRLAPYTTGSHAALFAGPTSIPAEGQLVVHDLAALPDELRPAGMLLTLDAIWRTVAGGPRARRLVVVDEAWRLMAQPAAARFLRSLAKAARKHWAGLAVVTQDAGDLLGSDLGAAVVANAATHLLLRQDASAISRVAATFALSDAEARYLTTAATGDALLLTAGHRTPVHVDAAPREHTLITTAPVELTPTPAPPALPRPARPHAVDPRTHAVDPRPASATGSAWWRTPPARVRPVEDDADPC